MKRLTTLLAIVALGIGGTMADELHEFKSADGSKSFRGLLMAYDANSSKVKVRHRKGKVMVFKLSLLSEEDQAYVKKKAPMLAAADGLRIDLNMNRKSDGKAEVGGWLCEKINHTYDITAENTLSNNLGTVDFEYSIFIERNRRNAEPVNEVVTGSHSISSFMGDGEEFFTTQQVTLENWSDNPPPPSGGGGG